MTVNYPKRLIEVDLPIKWISAHARREKSIRHISTLHIWWARRPPQAIMLGHLSPQRNDKMLARAAITEVFRRNRRDMDFALHTAPLYGPSRIIEIS